MRGVLIALNEFPEKTAQSAVLGANLNGKTPPGTAARAFLQGSHGFDIEGIVGMDFLTQTRAVIDLSRLEIHPATFGKE